MFTALNEEFWRWACFSWHLAKHWFTRQKKTKIQHAQNQTPQQVHNYRLTPEKKEKNAVREGGREKRRQQRHKPQSSYQVQEPTHAVPILTAERCCLLVDVAKFIILNMSDFLKQGDKHIYQAPHDIQCRFSLPFLLLSKQVPPINNSIGHFLRCSD